MQEICVSCEQQARLASKDKRGERKNKGLKFFIGKVGACATSNGYELDKIENYVFRHAGEMWKGGEDGV